MTAIWILGVIYATIPAFWMAVHPFANYWRSRKRSPFPALVLIWVAMILAVVFATRPWHQQRLYSNPLTWIPAVFFFACAIFIYQRSGRRFGLKNLIGRTELQPEPHQQTLVTTGMHARVRHPVYLGHLLMLTAWTIASGLAVMFGLWAFALMTGALMVRMEDAELQARFGDQFRAYRQRVPAVIPKMR